MQAQGVEVGREFVLAGDGGDFGEVVDLGGLVLGLDVPDGEGVVAPEEVVGVLADLDPHLAGRLPHHRVPAHARVEGGLRGLYRQQQVGVLPLAHRLHLIIYTQ